MSFFCFSPKQIYVVLNFITQSQFHIEIKRKKKKGNCGYNIQASL